LYCPVLKCVYLHLANKFLQKKNFAYEPSLVAWWSELLTTSHEVPSSIPGFAVGIFPCREDPHSDHDLGSLYSFGLRSPLVLHAHTHDHSHHRGNVNAPLWAPQLQRSVTLGPQPGGRGAMKFIWRCGGTGKKKLCM
jgi:hypothetical protein